MLKLFNSLHLKIFAFYETSTTTKNINRNSCIGGIWSICCMRNLNIFLVWLQTMPEWEVRTIFFHTQSNKTKYSFQHDLRPQVLFWPKPKSYLSNMQPNLQGDRRTYTGHLPSSGICRTSMVSYTLRN